VGNKKYDPLWELVGEKVALQGQEPDVDAHCPHCNVNLQLGPSQLEPSQREPSPEDRARIVCGLCGGVSVVAVRGGAASLEAAGGREA
jgi:hypothetical protein